MKRVIIAIITCIVVIVSGVLLCISAMGFQKNIIINTRGHIPIEEEPPVYPLESRYLGVAKYWNNLPWAFAFHVDDVTDPLNQTGMNQGWFIHQPVTLMMKEYMLHTPDSLVSDYHVEYGTHGLYHVDMEDMGYDETLDIIDGGRNVVEYYTVNTSIWSNLCISTSVPFGSYNPNMTEAGWDAGIRMMGNNNTYDPVSDEDWLRVGLSGYVWDGYDIASALDSVRSQGGFADVMVHPQDSFNESYFSFIENDTTGWHCTWGEVRSYSWFKQHVDVSRSNSSGNGTELYVVSVNGSDDRIWSVPVTLDFLVPRWDGTVSVDNQIICDDIGGFYPSIVQHRNQTMRIGYRYEDDVLHLSVCVSDGSVLRLGVNE